MKPLKSPTHIHFWRKFFMDSRQFFALWFWDFLHVLYAYYAERKFCHKYTRSLSPVWNRPPYTRIICEKNFAPQIYMRIAVRLESVWAIDWALVFWRSFVSCFVYAVIVWRKSFLLIGWCQSLVGKMWWDFINSL